MNHQNNKIKIINNKKEDKIKHNKDEIIYIYI